MRLPDLPGPPGRRLPGLRGGGCGILAHPENYRCGLDRMRAAGAVIVSTEMVLFELLEEAGTAEFKQILNLVK